MEQLPPLGKAIGEIVGPTFKIYAPILSENASKIKSVKTETFSFGSHERQKLDVYYPSQPAKTSNGRIPVLTFNYGGGLVNGAKTIPNYADGIVHANIASFFVLHYGYTVIIPDYRLMRHGAKFPSGGEDVAKVVDWICENGVGQGPEPIDLFMMGNSAGGVHLSTFLFDPSSFGSTRQKVLSGEKTRLRGAILLSVPFNFADATADRAETLTAYFGDIHKNCPLGLATAAREKAGGENFLPGVGLFCLNGDLDPDDEILRPKEDFLKEWQKVENAELRDSMKVDMMKGHNHISPCVSLGTGKEHEEAWGHQVGDFCESARK